MRAAGVLLLLALSVYGGSAAVQVKVRRASRGLEGLQMFGGGSVGGLQTFVIPLRCLQVGERSFPLEAVKQLKQLFNLNDDASPHLTEASVVSVCGHPLLPQIFRPVCQGKATDIVLSRLGKTPLTHQETPDGYQN